jgi:hypothetical protein
MITAYVGDLAYLDTFSGLIPVKTFGSGFVRGVDDFSDTKTAIQAKVIATRGAYRRGEVLIRPRRTVIPRPAVRRHKYKTTILPYEWKERSEL